MSAELIGWMMEERKDGQTTALCTEEPPVSAGSDQEI